MKLKNNTYKVYIKTIKDKKFIQKVLYELGYDLEIDGIIGNITKSILNITPTKVFFGKALEILNNKNSKVFEPLWLELAQKEIGVHEIHGPKHNPRVLQYHAVSGGFGTDEVPWCGSFVNFIMKKAGYKTPKYPARAKSWLKFGKSVYHPVIGAIAVKSRKGGGHVGFVMGVSEDGQYVYILGGNQNDAVNIKKYRTSQFLDFRIPFDYIPPKNNIFASSKDYTTAGREA